MLENEMSEFKRDYTENIYKEIVAFLNSYSGTIYIGYDDNGDLLGLENVKQIEEKISNEVGQRIFPDCTVFVSINAQTFDNKDYIVINVSKGLNVYYLKDKSILKGTYVRKGSCSIPATDETIKQMLLKNSNLSFETSVSIVQNLTFNYITNAFKEINIDINEDNIKRSLKMCDSNNKYTNLALLLSDQNPFTIKVAVYETFNKTNFLDRKEFSGSILELYDKTLEYLKVNSLTYGLIENTIRKDIEEYPEFVLREILLNSLIHRDYSTITSNIVNIYKDDGVEFISYGPLYGDITIKDILAGLSATRNPNLQTIFLRLKRVEAIGSGLRRVDSYYKSRKLNLVIEPLPSAFRVKLPRITLATASDIEDDFKVILEYINLNKSITRKEAEKLINKEKTSVTAILSKMVNQKIIDKIGNGPSTKYVLK